MFARNNPEPTDPRVPRDLIEKHGLETGLEVEGMAVPSPHPNQAPFLAEVQRLNGLAPEVWARRVPFKSLTAEDPTERIDLLLTDLMMPGISGREVIARFRILRRGVPIICVTGYATEREDDKALAVQVRAIIGKPFTSAALQQAIADALRSVAGSA